MNIKRNESAGESAGKDILIHEGRAVPVDLRQMRGKYDDKVFQYIGSPFVYDFHLFQDTNMIIRREVCLIMPYAIYMSRCQMVTPLKTV